ncbi:AbiJ-NTD4 domain-containing protein [Desulfoluna spongiiphila]|uniref:AbiJ-NTD4 domain-containing protein n=1 Tax=Desulfoluna spongiiphila TaxID=419481 RepID=UPI001258336F|nr:hypothetical protein [Desulfoluna spongiiphila]VVS90992.1 hypothetical protein DBB_5600 [Desulfoluna spongiiphila]
MQFSQRIGISPIEKILQKDSIDSELRNSLWSALSLCYWDTFNRPKYVIGKRGDFISESNLRGLFLKLWVHFFKEPSDTIPTYYYDGGLNTLRDYYFSSKWYQVYDFVEFVANHGPDDTSDQFIKTCNGFFERENAAYRFVEKKIIEISSTDEIEEIEQAISRSTPYYGVKQHITCAIAHLSNKENPDYRNSIKESISAVESLCKTISSNPKATLGAALKLLEAKGSVHPALKSAFNSLYGYTNDSGGIRHALLEESHLNGADARFMLISCSAFINYIITSVETDV